MSKQTAKSQLLSLMQASKGKSLIDAQTDYSNDLIELIADLITSSKPHTPISTTVVTPDTINGSGSQADAIGTMVVPP